MTITDDSSSTPAPASGPPSYVRRHPILAAFGVLSGLSLFSALWPLSAVVVGVAVAGHATGLDRAALHLAERLADRVTSSVRHRTHAEPAPAPPAPAPQPSAPAPSAPRREADAPAAPAAPAARPRRDPHARLPVPHRPVRTRRPATAERHVGSGIDGTGL
ncbi:MAG TPA: hypothetical protein VG299_02500 [Candidatus Dormibacteraeota bacterium]|nr:hypothetical protein [Candidatus Dormibacteraeota bacterium]